MNLIKNKCFGHLSLQREQIVQAFASIFSVLIIALFIFAIIGLNPSDNRSNIAYSNQGDPPTPTPITYYMNVIDRGFYSGNPDNYLRAGVDIANASLNNLHFSILLPTVEDSTVGIEIIDSTQMSSLTTSYGNRWSDNESTWVLVGDIPNQRRGAFYTVKDAGENYNGYKLSLVLR